MESFGLACSVSVLFTISLWMIHVSAERPAAYHVLDVAAWLREVNSPPAPLREYKKEEEVGKGDAWSLPLVHRDIIAYWRANGSYEERLREKLRRESRRVKALNRRTEMRLNNEKGEARIEDFGGEVESGMDEGSGEYFTRIGVGTPAREQYMVLDTGSDVVWVQCQPCKDCYEQADPIFDPSFSACFSVVPCGSTLCAQLTGSDCNGGVCLYRISYGDGSYTVGSFATETLDLGMTMVRNVAIGCGQDNEGLFVAAGGLLGLGAGAFSYLSQLGPYGAAFSYCLVDRISDSVGALDFPGTVFTPLLRNPRLNTFYYVALTGLSVGGLLVSLPPHVYQFGESGRGPVIVDSGTAVTRLQAAAYNAMRDAFLAGTTHLPRTDGVSIFDTCYDLSGRQFVTVPTVAFHFGNGAMLTLPAKNYLLPVDSMGTFCLAFAPTARILSIIGNSGLLRHCQLSRWLRFNSLSNILSASALLVRRIWLSRALACKRSSVDLV